MKKHPKQKQLIQKTDDREQECQPSHSFLFKIILKNILMLKKKKGNWNRQTLKSNLEKGAPQSKQIDPRPKAKLKHTTARAAMRRVCVQTQHARTYRGHPRRIPTVYKRTMKCEGQGRSDGKAWRRSESSGQKSTLLTRGLLSWGFQ